MPITFDCACGKTLRVPDQHAGKRVKCPACNGVATVPAAEPEPMFEVVEDTAQPLVSPPPPPKAPVRAKPVPARAADEDDEEDYRRGSGAKTSRRDDDDEEEEEKPKPKKKKKIKARSSPPRDDHDRSTNHNSTSATREIIGGLFAVLFGGALCVYAISKDRIPIYGAILLICGVIGLLKGLAGGSGDH